jgi:hypothetical protein
MEEILDASIAPSDLRVVLDDIGHTATVATGLLDGLGEAALGATAPGAQSCLALVQNLVDVGGELGRVAHAVLGHAPGALEAAYGEQASRPTGAQLLARLRYLREHIVSTVDQQGAAVWSTPTPAGRPLFAHAIDLQQQDVVLLAELRQAAIAARQG